MPDVISSPFTIKIASFSGTRGVARPAKSTLTRGCRFRILIKDGRDSPRSRAVHTHEPLHGDLRFQNGAVRKKPVLIICHSFMAFKDWGFFPHAGEQFAEKGFGAITFNFSQNGVEDDEDRITRFDRFEANTISREIADRGAVIDAVAEE